MTDIDEARAVGWIPDGSTFGARLAMVRQHVGWGNVELAATECGVPVQSWRRWERDGCYQRSAEFVPTLAIRTFGLCEGSRHTYSAFDHEKRLIMTAAAEINTATAGSGQRERSMTRNRFS